MSRDPAPAQDPFMPNRNTAVISGDAVASLYRWYVAAGLLPKEDGTFNKTSPERRKNG